MNELSITIIVVLLIMLVLAWVIGRRSGRTIAEVLTGKTVRRADRKDESKKRERNGKKRDVLVLISALITLSKQKGLYLIYPGALQDGGQNEALLAILVTRKRVLGITSFGYGGRLCAAPGEIEWTQELGDETRRIPNPCKKAAMAAAALREAMDANGLSHIPMEVFSVFTCGTVRLCGEQLCHCMRTDDFLRYLRKQECGAGELAPKEVGLQILKFTKQQT